MAKKDFKDYDSSDPQFTSSKEENSVKTGYRATQREKSAITHRYDQNFEAKTRRIQLILKPSLYEKVKKRAEEDCISFNEFVHRALERALEEDDL